MMLEEKTKYKFVSCYNYSFVRMYPYMDKNLKGKMLRLLRVFKFLFPLLLYCKKKKLQIKSEEENF